MTKDKTFKRHVRDRMAKTGESYAAARTHATEKRERVEAARGRLADTSDRPSDGKVLEASGKKWAAWFTLLDRWGARERKHGEIAAHLVDEYSVPGWWAQSITVWYERSRGLRLKHQQKDGFTVSASKTVGVAVEDAYDAFVNPNTRRRWLTDGSMSVRTKRPGRDARFNWGDGSTRVVVFFEQKGPAKTTVSVAHERLPDPDEAETAKEAWRERLKGLKTLLEAR
jgi:hypothetical protein